LCFEALETELVPQNNLPLQGAENTFRSQGFVWILKWICDEREHQQQKE
jgi:hypothetical protein